MITVEKTPPEYRPLAERVKSLQSEEAVAKYVEECFNNRNIGKKAMKKIMDNAQTQINLLRLRGPS